jgi:hypothetical protein
MKNALSAAFAIMILLIPCAVFAAEPTEAAMKETATAYFKAVAAKDYAGMTKDFDAKMMEALPPEKMKAEFLKTEALIGNYVSHEFVSIGIKDQFFVATYFARYTKEEKVTFEFAFSRNSEKAQLSGLWMKSPKMMAEMDVPKDEREKIIMDSKPVVKAFFAALKTRDYVAATKNFGPEMIKALPPGVFKANQEKNIDPVIGFYVSHDLKDMKTKAGSLILLYFAKFTKENEVQVKIVFDGNDPTYRITGLWFDSPKLRQTK